MRVIGGEFRSRRLVAPRGTATRPTSDRLRETLFNVLGTRIAGARFADLYAGSGAVGIEALSRGAAFCYFVERAGPALAAIHVNLEALQLTGRARLDSRSVSAAIAELARTEASLDLVFLDPPYEAAAEYAATLEALAAEAGRVLASGAVVIAEHARRSPLPDRFTGLARTRLLEQGDAALSFYAVSDGSRHPDGNPSRDPQ